MKRQCQCHCNRKQLARLLDLKPVLMRLHTNALRGKRLGLADDFLQPPFWGRIEAYRDIFNALYELEVHSQAENTETKSLVINKL